MKYYKGSNYWTPVRHTEIESVDHQMILQDVQIYEMGVTDWTLIRHKGIKRVIIGHGQDILI